MELHIQSEFDCVYFINGEFTERAESLTMSEYDVAIITVMPLDCALLPYTVKIVNADGINTPLALGVRLSSEHYLLLLAPRYPMVYRTCAFDPPAAHGTSRISRLFSLVKNDDMTAAYNMLSDNLKKSIDKKTLEAFFDGYTRIAECPWSVEKNTFYLITSNGAPKLHSYKLDGEFIDDIAEE